MKGIEELNKGIAVTIGGEGQFLMILSHMTLTSELTDQKI